MQGVARLADVERNGERIGRMVLTNDLWSRGFIYAESTSGLEVLDTLLDGPHQLKSVHRISIRETFAHPGGAQAHGDTIAIAMEQGPAPHSAAVFFVGVPASGEPEVLQRFVLDGTHGEPADGEAQTGTSAVGFIRLETGAYLLAVTGRKNGDQGIWFYTSDHGEEGIDASTQWWFTGFWKPPCAGGPFGIDDCFGGAGGLGLVADCSGQILLVNLNGNAGAGRDYEWMQVYGLDRSRGGDVALNLLSWQRDKVGLISRSHFSFRYGGGVYVTRDGRIAVFNTERGTNENENDDVDGDVYLSSP